MGENSFELVNTLHAERTLSIVSDAMGAWDVRLMGNAKRGELAPAPF
jgi:hypothetical protein